MRRVWEKLSEKEPRNFTGKLRLKKNFPVHTGCCFACFIYFIIYSYGYMMTYFISNTYYIFMWIHDDFFCLKVFETGIEQ
jgi:hypothetical protein